MRWALLIALAVFGCRSAGCSSAEPPTPPGGSNVRDGGTRLSFHDAVRLRAPFTIRRKKDTKTQSTHNPYSVSHIDTNAASVPLRSSDNPTPRESAECNPCTSKQSKHKDHYVHKHYVNGTTSLTAPREQWPSSQLSSTKTSNTQNIDITDNVTTAHVNGSMPSIELQQSHTANTPLAAKPPSSSTKQRRPAFNDKTKDSGAEGLVRSQRIWQINKIIDTHADDASRALRTTQKSFNLIEDMKLLDLEDKPEDPTPNATLHGKLKGFVESDEKPLVLYSRKLPDRLGPLLKPKNKKQCMAAFEYSSNITNINVPNYILINNILFDLIVPVSYGGTSFVWCARMHYATPDTIPMLECKDNLKNMRKLKEDSERLQLPFLIVALKYVHTGSTSDADNEVRILSALRHPAFPAVYAYFRGPEEVRIIALEFFTGQELTSTKWTRHFMTYAHVRRIAWQLISAIDYLHSKAHIMHRDIKPENILIDLNPASMEPQARIVDFAYATEIPPTHKLLNGLLGTVEYMAPEVMAIKPDRILEYLNKLAARDPDRGSILPTELAFQIKIPGDGYNELVDVWGVGVSLGYMLLLNEAFCSDLSKAFVRLVTLEHPLEQHEAALNRAPLLYNLLYAMLQPLKENRPSAAALLQMPIFAENIEQEHA